MDNITELLAQHSPRNRAFFMPPEALSAWVPGLDVKNKDDEDNATISVLDIIGVDFFTGQGVTAKRIDAALRSIGDKDVTVNINSPGGSFFEGLAIYSLLKMHPKKVTVNILGVAASAASVIAMAGDEINIPKSAFLMIHNTMIGVYGNKETMRREAEWLAQFDEVAADIYADKTGKSAKDISSLLNKAGEDGVWLSGKKAVEEGYADSNNVGELQNTGKTPEQKTLTSKLLVNQSLSLLNMTRAMRKEILSDLTGKPSAAESDMPSAVDLAGVKDDLISTIRQIKGD